MLGKYLNFYYRPAWFDKEWWPRFGLSPQPSERCMKAIWMEDHDLIKLVHKYNLCEGSLIRSIKDPTLFV